MSIRFGGNMRALTAVFGLALACIAGLDGDRPAAADSQGIAALVNDKVISTYDLDQRIKLVISTSGLKPTPESVARIREQVLRTLVDEELQLQEAAKVELKVPSEEVSMAIARLAQRSGLNRTQILQILAQAGVTEHTLRRQLEASIAWERLTQGRFGSTISVTEEDVNQSLEQLKANADKPQYWAMEIFLGVSSPDEEESVRKTMEGFMEQMRTGAASFPSIARQFSQSASAGSGGDIGWVTGEALPERVAEALKTMRKGSLSIPIRDVGGYYMVALRDKRIGVGIAPDQVKLTLKQVVIPALPDFPQQYIQMAGSQAVRIAQAKPSCDDAAAIARQVDTARYSDLGVQKVSDLTQPFQDAVAGMQAGDVTPPVRTEVGFHLLLICDRQTEGDGLPSRQAVEDRLYSQQLSMVQRRYLRDLRRDATVEIRDEDKKKTATN